MRPAAIERGGIPHDVRVEAFGGEDSEDDNAAEGDGAGPRLAGGEGRKLQPPAEQRRVSGRARMAYLSE